MALVFFNTLTRKKEAFHPLSPSEVKLYTCGPTVYDFAHIGNFRTYLFEDILRRWLNTSNYNVTQVMNITDVDDKTIRRSTEKGISLNEYTHDYINFFFEDLLSLKIEPAEFYPRATEYIPDMVQIITHLLEKKIAYKGEDSSIYYDVSKFPDYGKLANIEVAELKSGARVSHDEYDKEEASDFALWKTYDREDGDVFWETPLGKGRPGWHIECSAMSMKHLGPHFDIHTGGVDNIFPHHQNEIAQSEAYTGEKFVNYWLHAEHLIVDGKKMSKSLGNFYTVRDIFKKGFSPLGLRYFYVSSHYRNKLNFTFQGLQAAESSVHRIKDFVLRLKSAHGNPYPDLPEALSKAYQEFKEGMDDDLNTPRAVASVHELMNLLNPVLEEKEISREQAQEVIQFFLYTDKTLGLNLDELLEESLIPEEIERLISEREKARKNKDYRKSDEIRKTLQEKRFVIEDTPSGPRVKRI
jgi:cysteinyl-tRNA synthetase